jgi:hypothetical protein
MRGWLDKGREDLLLGRESDRDANRGPPLPRPPTAGRAGLAQRTPWHDQPIVERFLAASGRRQTMTRAAVAATLLAGVRVNPRHNLPYVFIPTGLASGFWMGQTEVTQQAFRAVMKSQPLAEFPGDDKPMHSVTWFEAQKFCELGGLRLPTEEEWERAARAGTTGEAYGDLDQIAVSGQTDGPAGVKSKDPNNWQLYDMLGNVWEWTVF